MKKESVDAPGLIDGGYVVSPLLLQAMREVSDRVRGVYCIDVDAELQLDHSDVVPDLLALVDWRAE